MENKIFTLTNKTAKGTDISLEPYGTIFKLLPGKSVSIELISESNPVFELQIYDDKDGISISLWPVKGDYEVFEETF